MSSRASRVGGICLLRAFGACLKLAQNGHAAVVAACPLLRDERTWPRRDPRSVVDPTEASTSPPSTGEKCGSALFQFTLSGQHLCRSWSSSAWTTGDDSSPTLAYQRVVRTR